MPRTTIDRRKIAVGARRNDELIAHAASLTGLAATALASAAGDLGAAYGEDRRPMTGLTQVVLEESGRISRLAGDIESHMNVPGDRSGRASVTGYTSVMD